MCYIGQSNPALWRRWDARGHTNRMKAITTIKRALDALAQGDTTAGKRLIKVRVRYRSTSNL